MNSYIHITRNLVYYSRIYYLFEILTMDQSDYNKLFEIYGEETRDIDSIVHSDKYRAKELVKKVKKKLDKNTVIESVTSYSDWLSLDGKDIKLKQQFYPEVVVEAIDTLSNGYSDYYFREEKLYEVRIWNSTSVKSINLTAYNCEDEITIVSSCTKLFELLVPEGIKVKFYSGTNQFHKSFKDIHFTEICIPGLADNSFGYRRKYGIGNPCIDTFEVNELVDLNAYHKYLAPSNYNKCLITKYSEKRNVGTHGKCSSNVEIMEVLDVDKLQIDQYTNLNTIIIVQSYLTRIRVPKGVETIDNVIVNDDYLFKGIDIDSLPRRTLTIGIFKFTFRRKGMNKKSARN